MITVARLTPLAHLLAAVPLPLWILALLLLGAIGTRVAGKGQWIDALVYLGPAGDRDEYRLESEGSA